MKKNFFRDFELHLYVKMYGWLKDYFEAYSTIEISMIQNSLDLEKNIINLFIKKKNINFMK